MDAIIMTKEYWMNSQLSIARLCGGIQLNGKEYLVVNKEGKTLYQCGIDTGEPADLIDGQYLSIYRKVGRERFIEMVEKKMSLKEMKQTLKTNKK